MDWETYKQNYQPKYMERIYHGSPLFKTTNGEYIFQSQKPINELDASPWLGGEVYGSRDLDYARMFADTAYERGLGNSKKIIGIDIDPDRFFDIGKNLNEQPEYVQRAIEQAVKDNPNIYNDLLIDNRGNIKPLPKLKDPAWNRAMDALQPYGVQGLYDSINKADTDSFVFRYAKDVPKGINLGSEGDNLLGLEDLSQNINKKTLPNLMKNYDWNKYINEDWNKINRLYNTTLDEKALSDFIWRNVNTDDYFKYQDVADNMISKELNEGIIDRVTPEYRELKARELILNDYMKAHPEGLVIQEPLLPTKTTNTSLSTPAMSITKQTPKPQVPVKQPTITPKQVDIPIGARLYEAGLNPKELAKLAKDPKVLSEVTKSLSKAITNPKTYLELGRGLISPTNIGLIASDILVNKADQAVHNRLKGKYNIKSQAEFNKLYPTLSTFERGQLGNTYPEMYQTYMKGR